MCLKSLGQPGMNLHQIDMNLLVMFDALYRHRSVSLAANEICISQSAFSHSLSRLRKHINDELFIRINNVMEPTLRADEIAQKLAQALPLISAALKESSVFDPKTDNSEFTFSATDYTEFSLFPKLINHITNQAPNVKIKVIAAQEKLPISQLENQDIDFALGYSHEAENSTTINSLTWLKDSYCTIARKGHPALKHGLSLAVFLKLFHIRVSPWGESQGIVDQVLAKQKLSRNVTLQLPSVLVAPHAVVHSDLLLTMPRLIAEQLTKQINIELFEPPIAIPNYHLKMYRHRINSGKANYIWLREQVESFKNLSNSFLHGH